jgi:hypothetical protein
VGRYFRYALSATGCATAYSTADRGWRIGVPAVIVKSATNVSFTSAKLNFQVTEDGGSDCEVRVGYGTSSHIAADFNNYTTITAWAGAYGLGDQDGVTVTNLVLNTVFYFRVQVRNADGTVVTSDETYFDTTSMPSMLSDYTLPGGTGFLTDDPLMPPKMYTEGDVEVLPLGELIREIAEQSSSNPDDQQATLSLWLYLTIFPAIGILALCVFRLSRRGGGEGSGLLMFITIEGCLVLFGLIGSTVASSLIPLFPAFLYLIGDVALMLSENRYNFQ